MKKNLLLSLAFCTLGAVAVQAQTTASAIKSKKQTLYDSQDTPSTPYRIPAIATMGNNEVIAIADYRPCGADVGNGDVDIYARISADNGLTWSGTNTTYDDTENVIKIADGGTGTSKGYGDAAVAADPNSGQVVVMCVGGGSTIYSSAKTSTTDYLCIRNYSKDYGRTWTQANVTSYFKGDNNVFGADVASMFFGSGKLAVSKKVEGRIYGALLVKQGKSKVLGTYISYEEKNYVVYSDDWGASWKLLGSGACCSGGNEPKVEELPNGDILLSSRASGARYFNVFNFTNIESATGTWGTATSCSFSGSNSTNGEILLYQGVYLVGDQSGTKYNVVLQSLPTGSSRSNVSVYYKTFAATKSSWAVSDFTSSWTKGIEVDDGASAYSTMTILPNGQVGFLYEDNYDTSKASGDYSDIVYVPLTVEEITGGAYTTTAPVATPVDPTISLSAAATTLTVGETTALTLNTNSDGAVSYTSNNTAVATVNASGVVTAVAAGSATITANVAATANYNAASATVTITVNAPVATPVDPTISLSATATTLTVGETTALTLTTNSDGAVTYTSSNTAVATVNADGVVTAVAAGTATITANVAATASYNAASATVTITVESNGNEGGNEGEEATTYDVTAVGGKIGATSYYIATFSAPVATIVPSGVKAYYVKVGGSDVVTLTRISSGKVIPAGQGVILISSTQTFTMTSTTDESNVADLTGNLMAASLDGTIPAGGYVLAVKGSGDLKDQFAFCLTSSEFKLSSGNRAYLQLSGNNAPQMRMRIEDESTDIEASELTNDEAPVIYDLTGRRVTEMLPGRIYIVNGRKMVR